MGTRPYLRLLLATSDIPGRWGRPRILSALAKMDADRVVTAADARRAEATRAAPSNAAAGSASKPRQSARRPSSAQADRAGHSSAISTTGATSNAQLVGEPRRSAETPGRGARPFDRVGGRAGNPAAPSVSRGPRMAGFRQPAGFEPSGWGFGRERYRHRASRGRRFPPFTTAGRLRRHLAASATWSS